MSLRPGKLRDGGAELGVRRQRRVIDLMHDFEELVGLEPVLLHQAAHGGAVAAVIILLQPERLVAADLEKVDDVVADALIDLLPEIEVMRIERVVEIEHPGLDLAKTALIAGAVAAALGHDGELVVAIVPGEEALNRRRISFINRRGGIKSMRRRLRKSIPFLLAIFFGTMAGALVAGVALFASHS